jgi:hypothetical protein
MIKPYTFVSVGYDWKDSSSQDRYEQVYIDSRFQTAPKTNPAPETDPKGPAPKTDPKEGPGTEMWEHEHLLDKMWGKDQEHWSNIQNKYKEYVQQTGEPDCSERIKLLTEIRFFLMRTNWYSKYTSLVRGACQGEVMKEKVVIMACVSGISPIARVERSLMEDIKRTIIKDLGVRHQNYNVPKNLIIKRFETCEELGEYLDAIWTDYRAADVGLTHDDFRTEFEGLTSYDGMYPDQKVPVLREYVWDDNDKFELVLAEEEKKEEEEKQELPLSSSKPDDGDQ